MLEQLYADFTTKMLPQIQAGLTITKDYFLDLFGRYAHFLFVQDLIFTIACGLAALACTVTAYKIVKFLYLRGKENNIPPESMFVILLLIPLIFSWVGFFENLTNTLKDKYIPEIRIYEEIKGFTTKQ